MTNVLTPIEATLHHPEPLEAQETAVFFDDLDGLMTIFNNELSCLVLLTFPDRSSSANPGHVRDKLKEWQKESLLGTIHIGYERVRQSIPRRLEKGGLLERDEDKKGSYSLTQRGLASIGLAGHLLDFVATDLRGRMALSDILGHPKNIPQYPADELEAPDNRFEAPLLRTSLLAAMHHAYTTGENDGFVLGERIAEHPSLAGLEITSRALEDHAIELTRIGFLEQRTMRGGNFAKAFYYRVNPEYAHHITKLVSIISSYHKVDVNWKDFFVEGVLKAQAIIANPTKVATLLLRNEESSRNKYSISREEMVAFILELCRSKGTVRTGEVRTALGDKHNLQYLSNLMGALVTDGTLVRIGDSPRSMRYSAPA